MSTRQVPEDRIKRLTANVILPNIVDERERETADEIMCHQAGREIAEKLMDYRKVLIQEDNLYGMTRLRFSIEVIVPESPAEYRGPPPEPACWRSMNPLLQRGCVYCDFSGQCTRPRRGAHLVPTFPWGGDDGR